VSETSTDHTIESYRQAADEMAALVGEQGHTLSTRRRDRLADRLHHDRLALQRTPEGRAAIADLLDDPRPHVRLAAAGAVLLWDAARARPVLEELRESPARYGLHAISAKHILIEYDAHRLEPDSRLPGG
jgi:Domain of unknown function (DUF2019)